MLVSLFRPYMSPEAIVNVAETLTPKDDGSLYIGEGPQTEAFEREFQKLVYAPYPPLAMASCTVALDLSLHLAGVSLGSEVISTPLNCTAGSGVIVNRGAKIVWADIHPLTGLIDPSDVARKVTHRTKAIMAVDWAGRTCDYNAIRKLISRPIPIIEDAAHAIHIPMDNRGDLVAWSTQAIKFLTTGDGGFLLVPENQRERARLLRWYGLDRLSNSDFRCSQSIKEAGYKYSMNDIAASIGLANIKHTQRLVDIHRENASFYDIALEGLPGVTLSPYDPKASYWIYSVLVENPTRFIAQLAEQGVSASPVHRRNDVHPAFCFPNGPLPGVDAYANHMVSIPVGWWVTPEEREYVAEAVIATQTILA